MRLIRGAVLFALMLLSWSECPATAQEQKDREFQECIDCPVMVGIPAGAFIMGSPASEAGHFDAEGPQHRVEIRAFALGKFDVTTAQFLAFLAATGYQPAPCNAMLTLGWQSPGNGFAYPRSGTEPPRWPATCIGFKDALAYIAWLNTKVPRPRREGPYRLPSEAEWEYA
ncbi:MAG: formylglycine-generating enzyme family protein, partial [Minisyncoccia bacterium]